jgi:hypothetical protein
MPRRFAECEEADGSSGGRASSMCLRFRAELGDMGRVASGACRRIVAGGLKGVLTVPQRDHGGGGTM